MTQSSSSAETGYLPEIKNAQMEPDLSRLPSFYTSDFAYDEFANEYFMRHLSIDKRGVYTGGVLLGAVNHMWVVEWDWWMLPWIDRGAMGLARQGGNKSDIPLTTLVTCAVDKYGYTWGARPYPEAKNVIGSHIPTFGWPWPKYNWNRTVTQQTGWDFNDINDGFRDKWTSRDMELQPGYVDFSLAGKVTGPKPELVSPKFDCDSFQIPIIELDITYKPKLGKNAYKCIDGLKVYWTTDANPRFSEARMVTADFSAMPPKQFAVDYTPWVSDSEARYSLYFPMYLHPEWGKGGHQITRLKIVPVEADCIGDEVSVNYVRASYDVRLSTTNATLINAAYKFYMWNGDDRFLKEMMPKLRKSITFMNEHLRGKADKLINFDWFVGHDGLGGDQPGHGLIGCYWDLLPAGRFDLESSYNYYHALTAMAELERIVARKKIDVPGVNVIGPDNRSVISYGETPESLKSLASKVKSQIEKIFWNEKTGRFARNIDIKGVKHDYGFLHHNLTALAFGIGTKKQRASILSCLDGTRI
ncbi:MAG: glucosidase family protein, partial [Armatimonadota bacterium]